MANYYKLVLTSILLVLLTGCINSKTSNIQSIKVVKKAPIEKLDKPIISKNEFYLAIKTEENARIRIMNIKPKYKQGILLKKDNYLIEITKAGFIKYKSWIHLDEDKILTIKLKKATNALNGYITWDYKQKNDPYFYDVMNFNKHVWTNSKTLHQNQNTDWARAKRYCDKLSIKFNGITLSEFELPGSKELKNLWDYRYYSLFYKEAKANKHSGQIWTNKTKIQKDGTHVAKMFSLTKQEYSPWYNSGKVRQNSPIRANIICVKNEKEDIAYTGAVDLKRLKNKSILEIAKVIFNSKINYLNTPSLVKKPKLSYLKLRKSQFETVEAFERRIHKSNSRVEHKYKKQIEKWKQTNENIKLTFKNNKKDFQKNKNNQYLKALEKAVLIKYGKPYISDIKYSAKKELMIVTLQSNRNNYNKKVQITVKKKNAKKFKKILLKKDFTPIIKYKVIDSKLIFSSIAQISNPT